MRPPVRGVSIKRGASLRQRLPVIGELGRSASLASATITERNALYLCVEVFWWAFLNAVITFNAAYAIRLGASNAEVGLLTSIPALLAVLVTIPAGQIMGSRSRRMPLVVWSLFVHRLGYLVMALVPWIPAIPHGTAVVWLLVAMSPSAHFFGVGWSSMLADIIPEGNRARLFAIRSMIVSAVTTVSVFIAGWWLDRVAFPLNYQTMFFVGFAASMISLYYILKLQVPDSVVPLARPQRAVSMQSLLPALRQAASSQHDFVRMNVNTFAHGLGLWLVAPLYMLYYVRELGASDGWLGINGTLANLAPVAGLYLWQRAIQRWGENPVLKLTIGVVGLYPLLVGMTPNLAVIPLWTALHGLVAPGVSISHFPMLLKVCPDAQRPLYLGIHTSVMNLGAFVMPLLGVSLAAQFGLAPVLMAGGILCLLGSSTFRFRPLQTPDSVEARRRAT